MAKALTAAKRALAKRALSYPETREDHPWGHSAFKVKGKTFLFLFSEKDFLSLSLKLPESGRSALQLPFASPTEYGLGKSGWITAKFRSDDEVPVEMLTEWLEESFRAIAPKKVVAQLDGASTPAAGRRPAR
jgi:predicted DNA-binding protein (MmcQ/YjbR family)